MALIVCPDCRKEFSSLAPACPNCGRPNSATPAATRRVEPALVVGIALMPLVFVWFTLGRGYSTVARVAAFAWLSLTVLAGGFLWWLFLGLYMPWVTLSTASPSPRGMSALDARIAQRVNDPTPDPTEATPPSVMASAYRDNQVAADIRFRGRSVIVSGVVSAIGTGPDGSPFVTISDKGTGGPGQVMALFGAYMAGNVAQLHSGESIKVQCTGAGLAGPVVIEDCGLLEPAFSWTAHP